MSVDLGAMRELCGERAISFSLRWIEVTDSWEAYADGQGLGEWWATADYAAPEAALNALRDQISEYPRGRGAS